MHNLGMAWLAFFETFCLWLAGNHPFTPFRLPIHECYNLSPYVLISLL